MSANTKYIEGIGRRKNAIARVRITESTKSSVTINDKSLNDYFPTLELQKIVESPFNIDGVSAKFALTAKVNGGGIHSQAESVRLGVARALVEFNDTLRGALKKPGYLKRDPRAKERKKFGLKKARKAAQWSKR